jgi:hypothetical protein
MYAYLLKLFRIDDAHLELKWRRSFRLNLFFGIFFFLTSLGMISFNLFGPDFLAEIRDIEISNISNNPPSQESLTKKLELAMQKREEENQENSFLLITLVALCSFTLLYQSLIYKRLRQLYEQGSKRVS